MPSQTANRAPGKHLHFHVGLNGGPSALSATVARNVRLLRLERDLSIEGLAERAGLEPAILQQIETAKGEPTLECAWRIANAFGVPFSALIADQVPRGSVVIRRRKANRIVSRDLGLTTRALSPFYKEQPVEFYELHLAPGYHEISEPHKPGTLETILVATGVLEISVGREPLHIIEAGDSISFPADLPHSYRNPTPEPARLYLVITYQQSEGAA